MRGDSRFFAARIDDFELRILPVFVYQNVKYGNKRGEKETQAGKIGLCLAYV
ncbi:hypothetical protein HMPREF1573_01378 [Gardnerella vaginalis JCP7276]|nr:hypothetical protein HMPREF1575_00818 [Gardnerella vaginalis JCP7672]EPI54521.1 hypothetical protein HMPREF1573_01378 [Gardnerella vaginalis JCP7276]